ncbi:MAG: hypothetical protein IJ313_05165 [Clostridia bacterium]|nr:hypothetical protein [Clostridia bacterium]
MDIAASVQEIIDKRSKRLVKIEQCERHLAQVTEGMDALDAVIRQMVDANGAMIAGSPYASLLNDNPGMAAMVAVIDTRACRKAIDDARAKLADYKLRSSRDGVYISVVGVARAGKSAVLQAFSGLNNNFIPSSSGADCTGATSIIHNVSGGRAKVILAFKSREEMVALAQQYLDEMIEDPMKRKHLYKMEDIRAINLNEIRMLMKPGSSKGVFMDKLRDLVEHYDEWSPYAGRTAPLETYDEKEIVTFVAQMDDEGKEYHKYLVVKTCDIECEFPEKGAGKIKLIDTIGLGDNALGIGDTMLRTVRDESDAVIMVIKPNTGTGSGLSSDIVNSLYGPIYESCKDRNLNDWLFYLINHVSKTVEKKGSTIPKNTQLCEMTKATIGTSGWMGHEPCIVDAMDKAETQQFLNMVLCSLMDKLDSVDEVFRKGAEDALKEAWRTYSALVDQIVRIVKDSVTSNTQVNQMLQDLCDKVWEDQSAVLRLMAFEWRKKRSQPCPGLFNASQNVLNRMMYGVYLPRTQAGQPDTIEIERALERAQLPEVLSVYMNRIRTRIKDDFVEVSDVLDKYINSMKDGVAQKLCKELSLGRIYAPQDGQSPREWMTEFAQEKLEGYPALKSAVDTINSFTFSVKGFLTYEVREVLEVLDPDLYPVEGVLIMKGGALDRRCTAINIYDELDRRLVIASKKLKTVIIEMCTKPNRGICAEVEDFVDRMLYAKGAKSDWRKFYMGEAGAFWAEEIKQHQANSQVSGEWNDLVHRLRQNLSKSRFTLEG